MECPSCNGFYLKPIKLNYGLPALQILFAIFLVFFMHDGNTGWDDYRSTLDEVYIIDEFRIFYNLKGEHSLPDDKQNDVNGNGYPDYVEELGNKLVKAREFFDSQVGLVHPLQSDRFNLVTDYIDVNLLNLPLQPGGPDKGAAYDSILMTRDLTGTDHISVLTIDLSINLAHDHKTPEHELFHLYQNGYTMFKNRWYTEGTARWSENILDDALGTVGQLPGTTDELHKIFAKSYETDVFWNTICRKIDSENNGKLFIKTFLEELEVLDDVASEDRGLEYFYWQESIQKDTGNNTYIWQALINTLERPEFKGNWDEDIEKLADLKF